ncbi:MAG: PspC domain-containing protein [Anaerolineae bacterium]|jgi:phage shock protein C|nr:PspC domain-containing protein [Anaerolineae bacterium]
MDENKKLYRSRTDRMLGGVCAGLADFFGLDPSIMRLIFVALLLGASFGFWLYIILWIVVPEEPLGSGSAADAVVDVESKEE